MIAEVHRIYVKIVFASEVDILLTRNSPERPAGRYNRLGQDALYLSKDEQSARVAMQKYRNPSDPKRVLVSFEVTHCRVLDLRHPEANRLRQLASQDWQSELASGLTPASWQVADKVRESDEAGLIDPSRKQASLWHLTLLRWNQAHAPQVAIVSEPVEISL